MNIYYFKKVRMLLLSIHVFGASSHGFISCWVFLCSHHLSGYMLLWCGPSNIYILASRTILLDPTLIHSQFLKFLVRLFFWCPLFDFKPSFVAIGVLIWSVIILLVSTRCLMVLVSWVSLYFAEVVAMSRFSSALKISPCIVMAMLAPWKSDWVAFMRCSYLR